MEPWGPPRSNLEDVRAVKDVGIETIPPPQFGSLPDTGPPLNPQAPNPADVDHSDTKGDSVGGPVEKESASGRSPRAGSLGESLLS